MGVESLREEGWGLMQGWERCLAAKDVPDHRGRPDCTTQGRLECESWQEPGGDPVQTPHFTDGKSEGMCLALGLTGG